jgi:pimeloyl-ACP methyl ester carboxylesterase
MNNQYLEFKEYKMYYHVYGNGNKILLAFHGFGRDGTDFKLLEPTFGKEYKIISFDLFYHGESDYPMNPESINFTGDDLKVLIQQYLKSNSIDTFSILAYSLGGRISFTLLELFPYKIENVYLFAPDGIKYSWGYNFVTKSTIGKYVYKSFIKSPSFIFLIFKLGNAIGLINNSVYKFLRHQLETQPKRQKVYDTWVFFRNIHPDIPNVQHIINTKSINIQLYYGKFDTIIPPRFGKEFVKGLNNKDALHILDSGHNLIKESVNQEIRLFVL